MNTLLSCVCPSVYRSVELKAVAAISAGLFSEGQELQVRGPIQVTLPLGPGTNLRPADTVPAWAFNPKTGRRRLERISVHIQYGAV